jgi:hypothetical protein
VEKQQQTSRFDRRFIVFQDNYKNLKDCDFEEMFKAETERRFQGRPDIQGAVNIGQQTYRSKFAADFSIEMNRSVRDILKNWTEK